MRAIIGLPCPQLRCQSSISRIRYGYKHTLQHVLSYLSEAKARSQTYGHFFMGWQPKDGKPICLNRALHVSANILRFVVASAAEAELGALYHNRQTGIVFWQTLKAMGHMQPKTPVHCNNAAMVGIANNTVNSLSAMDGHDRPLTN